MNSRLGKIMTRNLLLVAFMIILGIVLGDGTGDTRDYYLIVIPLVYVVAVLSDYFLWTNPRFKDPDKPEKRPNIRL